MILSMTLLAGCGSSSKKDVVVTIDDEDIYLNEAMYYIYMVEANFGMMIGLDYWDTLVDDERTFADTTKEYVMDSLVDMHILALEGEKAGLEISPEYDTQLKASAVEFYNSMSDEIVDITGLNEQSIYEIVAKNYIGSMQQNFMINDLDIDSEAIAAEYDREELRQYNTEFLQIPFVSIDEEGNQVELTDEEKATAKETLEKVLTEIESGKTFDEIIEEYEDITKRTSNFAIGTNAVNIKYEEAAIKLENDEITKEVIETDNSYYIIKMIDNNSDEYYNSIISDAISQKQQELFQEQLDEIKENYTITTNEAVWDTVKLGRTTINLDVPETETDDTGKAETDGVDDTNETEVNDAESDDAEEAEETE